MTSIELVHDSRSQGRFWVESRVRDSDVEPKALRLAWLALEPAPDSKAKLECSGRSLEAGGVAAGPAMTRRALCGLIESW